MMILESFQGCRGVGRYWLLFSLNGQELGVGRQVEILSETKSTNISMSYYLRVYFTWNKKNNTSTLNVYKIDVPQPLSSYTCPKCGRDCKAFTSTAGNVQANLKFLFFLLLKIFKFECFPIVRHDLRRPTTTTILKGKG